MVVYAFTRHRVVSITLRLSTERTDHLRVTADAAFTDVDVTAFQLQRGVRLHAFHGLVDHVLKEQRNDLGQAADAHCQNHEQSQQADVFLEYFVLLHQSAPQAICAAASYSAGLAACTVRQVL